MGKVIMLLLTLVVSAEAVVKNEEILKRIDSMDYFENDYSVTVKLVIQNDSEKEVFENRVFRNDKEQKVLMLTLKPEISKGSGYLSVEARWWFYDPLTRKFILSSPHENVEGSEFKVDDFSNKKFSKEYTVTNRIDGVLGKNEVYILDLKANNKLVVTPQRRVWVTKKNYLLLKQEDRALSGTLVRTLYLSKWKKFKNNYICMKAFAVNELHKGNKSLLIKKDISFDKIQDFVFTKSYIVDVNK